MTTASEHIKQNKQRMYMKAIKSGTIYDDAFLQWESSFGWIDRSVSASIDPKSTTHIQVEFYFF